MRRLLVLAVAIVGFALPSASMAATSIQAQAVSVTPTHAVIRVAWTVDFFTADVSLEYGPSADFGLQAIVQTNVTSGGPQNVNLTGLSPGTTYHLRGRLDGKDAQGQTLVTTGLDKVFTTPKLGGALLALQTDSLVGTAVTPASPAHGSGLHTCSDPAPTPPGPTALSRFRAYQLTNPAASAGCVTVQVSSPCPALRVIAYKNFTGDFGANVVADDSSTGTEHEFQFPVAKDETFHVAVADAEPDDGTGCDAEYTIAVFTTSLAAPLATTARPTLVGVHSATLNGLASAQALAGITTRLEWGPTLAYGKTIALGALPRDNATHKFAPRLKGLAANTLYHVRIVTTNGLNPNVNGTDFTFRTLKSQPPLALKSTTIGVKSNSVASVKIACPATTVTCTGSVVLRRSTGNRARLGSKAFRLNGGQTAIVAVKLSSSNRKLVKKLKTVKVTVALGAKDDDKVPFPTVKPKAKLVWRG